MSEGFKIGLIMSAESGSFNMYYAMGKYFVGIVEMNTGVVSGLRRYLM
jgi:hypothetical protein